MLGVSRYRAHASRGLAFAAALCLNAEKPVLLRASFRKVLNVIHNQVFDGHFAEFKAKSRLVFERLMKRGIELGAPRRKSGAASSIVRITLERPD